MTTDIATKTCFKCGRELPIDMFYAHKTMRDGRSGKCKDCTIEYARVHRLKNLDRIRESERSHNLSADSKKRRRKYEAYYRTEYPERIKAQGIAKAARNRGQIPWEPCFFCGSTSRREMHHPDYAKPLDIVWLCVTCHRKLHAMMKL